MVADFLVHSADAAMVRSRTESVDAPAFIITGGAGFIGSAIAWMLNKRGIDDILIVDTLGTGSAKWLNLRGLRFRDIWSPAELLARLDDPALAGVSAVIHMGACSATTEADADYLLENNYRYSQRLGTWALGQGKRFLYASSAAVYGDGSLGFSDDPELLPRLRPLNMYGYSKQLFDLHVMRSGWDTGCVGLRYFNIFGPNEYHKGSMLSMVFKAVQQIRLSGQVRLFKSTVEQFADGEQVRDFLYVKDAAEIVWQLLERPQLAGIFNVGSGTASSWNALAKAVFQAMERPADIRYIDMPEELRGRYQSCTAADMRSLKAALGGAVPARPLAEAVEDYVKGYLAGAEPRNFDFERDHTNERQNQ